MMSGHDANPILFKKKNKDWTSRDFAISHPVSPITSHFCLTHPHPPQSGRHEHLPSQILSEFLMFCNIFNLL